jgi:hypothetical protein
MYKDAGWDEQEPRSVTGALNRMLQQNEPYPALVMDRYWTVLQTNTAAPRFFNSFVELSAHPQPRNLLHLMFDPAGMRPFVANWEEVARTLIQRVARLPWDETGVAKSTSSAGTLGSACHPDPLHEGWGDLELFFDADNACHASGNSYSRAANRINVSDGRGHGDSACTDPESGAERQSLNR